MKKSVFGIPPLLASMVLSLVVFTLQPTTAQAQAPTSRSLMAAKCDAMLAEDFSTIADAPTRLTSTKLIEAAGGKPAYCITEGNVAPQVGILMWLPTENWNGKFLQLGCGGFCGTLSYIALCEVPLKRGFACITTDMGHKGNEDSVGWAYNNPQAVVDFAYRATHVTALAGKGIIERYYGRKPDRSFFQGCSCGGRQALVEAQRFHDDFNGIIVGAPGFNYPEFSLSFALRAKALYTPSGKPLFTPAEIQLLGSRVVAKCDLNDGVKDGMIGDPRLCHFDPRNYVCKSGSNSGCLTREQAEAAVSYYKEYRSASGTRLGDRALLPGSEVSMLGMADTPLLKPTFYEDFFRYMAFIPNPGPVWKFKDFDLESDPKRMGLIQSLLRADDPDLRDFKSTGGKMIFYHGWGDGGLSPLTSIDYYKTVERTMGGRTKTEDFLRLFLVPDMDHCFGGQGPWAIDYLSYLEKWVEHGEAPDVMIGAHFSADPMAPIPTFATPKFTRPVYPYPLRAQYKGSGDPTSAASFEPVSSPE